MDNIGNTDNTGNTGKARIEYTLNFDEQGKLKHTAQPEFEIQPNPEQLARLRAMTGKYTITPPPPLMEAATRYYYRNTETVQKALEGGGATEETITAVLEDYRRTLFGITPLRATPEQMRAALTAVLPMAAFNLDRYVFYLGVLRPYNLILSTLNNYALCVKQQPDAEQRQQYFDKVFTDMVAVDAVAFGWLRDNGIIAVSDFAGLRQSAIARFLGSIDATAEIAEYCTYYCVCKFAFNAPTEQLKEINPPYSLTENFLSRWGGEPPYIIAERVADDLAARFRDIAEKFNNVVRDAAEQKPVTEQAREIVRVPEKMALILSRDIYAAEGPKAKKILPISRYIQAYLENRGTDAVFITTNLGETRVDVTPRTIEKAIEGVNLLQQIYRVKPVNGYYRFETNLSEFSELCGYTDANDEEKAQLLASLKVLHDLYLVVWEKGGRSAVQVINVPKIGLSGKVKGKFEILVTTEAMRGRPQLVSIRDFFTLRRLAKGAAKNHFRYQILAKGQMEERALVSQVFGYEYKLDELKDKPDEYKAAREYIRKHRNADIKNLQKWFEEYAQLGFIEYTRAKNAKGEYIYKWRRIKPATEQEKAEIEQNKLENLFLKASGETEADVTA